MLVLGTLFAAGGVLIVACSSDNSSSSGGLPEADGGKDGQSSGNLPDGNSSGGLDGSAGDADCSKAPKLHSDDGGSVFCPFIPKFPDGGFAPNCTASQVCCNPGDFTTGPDAGSFAPSYCTDDATKGTATDNTGADTACSGGAATFNSEYPGTGFATDWECTDKTSCATGKVCCLVTDAVDLADGGNVNIGKCTAGTCKPADIPVACGALEGFKYGGTRCKDSCAAQTEIQMCGFGDPCTAGTCTAFRVVGSRDLAYCKP